MLCSGFLHLGQLDSSVIYPTCPILPVISSYLPGSQNRVAHALSRPSPVSPSPPFPVSAMQSLPFALPVDFYEFSSFQLSCLETTALLSNAPLRVVSVLSGESSVLCDLSTSLPRPLVPVSPRCRIFEALHNISHPGVCPTQRLVCRVFVWSGIFTLLFLRFWFRLEGSATFTWTWLALSPVPEVIPTSSPSWTEPPVSHRPFRCPGPPLRIVLEPWFPVGSPGLVFQPRLLLTMKLNLPLFSGVFYVPF